MLCCYDLLCMRHVISGFLSKSKFFWKTLFVCQTVWIQTFYLVWVQTFYM